MGYYDGEETVEQYIRMTEGYDGRDLIDIFRRYVPPGSSVLELGMGPGKDLEILEETYRATGSDKSTVFLERYGKNHPGADLLLLDAVTCETDRSFDAIYSNKVLIHLSYTEIAQSFDSQTKILNPEGVLFHSFWYGDKAEEYEGLPFYQMTENRLESLIPPSLEAVEMVRYGEMEKNDSLYGIFRLK